MDAPLYSARIGESLCIVNGEPYEALLELIIQFTARGAVARSVDEGDWEHEELRRKGLSALQIFRNGKAVWRDRRSFDSERAEAEREHIESRFDSTNELDIELYESLDRDLRRRWRGAGYEVPSLIADMKKLFSELERDAGDCAARAREGLVGHILKVSSS